METIDFAEKAVDASLKEARASYDAMHERAYKFATLTMGASGAVSIYALGVAAHTELTTRGCGGNTGLAYS